MPRLYSTGRCAILKPESGQRSAKIKHRKDFSYEYNIRRRHHRGAQKRTEDTFSFLNSYHLIHKTELEVDDATQPIYTFNPNPAIMGLLIFAREMIDRPNNFYYYSGGR